MQKTAMCCFHIASPLLDLMTGETVSPQLRSKVPDHQTVIQRPRYQLLHVGVENHGRDSVLVAPEGPFQGRVRRLGEN